MCQQESPSLIAKYIHMVLYNECSKILNTFPFLIFDNSNCYQGRNSQNAYQNCKQKRRFGLQCLLRHFGRQILFEILKHLPLYFLQVLPTGLEIISCTQEV